MVAKVPFIGATTAQRPRNGFDLSQRHLFTCGAGMLLPVLSLDLLPNDNVKINARDFMRCLPMNSSAFISMRGVYEFFFVPYHQLWSPFDQFITGMKDFKSSLVNNRYSGTLVQPYLDLSKLHAEINKSADPKLFAQSGVDDLGFKKLYGANRLLDMLGYGAWRDSFWSNKRSSRATVLPDTNIKVSPWRILAYNKIYSDYYRNTSYEPYDVNSFNVDDITPDLTQGFSEAVFSRSFKLRYRNAGLDMLTNIRPTLNISAYNGLITPDSVGLNLMQNTAADGTVSSNNVIHNTSGGTELSVFGKVPSGGTYTHTSINLRSLRSAFAFDKLIDITVRAGKTFEEQMEAHFGVKIPESRDGRCTFIGGFDSPFNTDDVIQTSGTSSSPENDGVDADMAGYLGRVAGKSIGHGAGSVNFTAREHGVLMCIYSIIPELGYDATRVDPMVEKVNRFDYFTPEYENLGLQPVKARSFSYFTKTGDNVIGFQPRYSEYKTAIDINHGQFIDRQGLSAWTGHRLFGDFNDFRALHYKINPKCVDWIFPVDFDGIEAHDEFFGGCNFNIVKVSDMSVDGLPRV